MRILLLLVVLATFTLAACGNRGGLERAPPLWGEEHVSQPAPAAEEDEDLFADEEEARDGRPSIPGRERFEDDGWID